MAPGNLPFLVAGTFAVNCYTGINRATKDLDIFCKPGDFPASCFVSRIWVRNEIEDERWLAKVRRGDCFFDVIFSRPWGRDRQRPLVRREAPAELYNMRVQLTPPTEMIWSKALLQDRHPLRWRRHRPPDPAPE